jgi:hypothetical protein
MGCFHAGFIFLAFPIIKNDATSIKRASVAARTSKES